MLHAQPTYPGSDFATKYTNAFIYDYFATRNRFHFASEKMVDGCVADRDICWNGKGLVPNHDVDNRIYTLGSIPSLEGVAVDKGKFAYGQFPVTGWGGFCYRD